MKNILFKAGRSLFDHIPLPTDITHSCYYFDIIALYDEVVINVGCQKFRNFNHKTIGPDLSLLLNANNTRPRTPFVIESVYDVVRIFLLIWENILGSRLVVALEEQHLIIRLLCAVCFQYTIASSTY